MQPSNTFADWIFFVELWEKKIIWSNKKKMGTLSLFVEPTNWEVLAADWKMNDEALALTRAIAKTLLEPVMPALMAAVLVEQDEATVETFRTRLGQMMDAIEKLREPDASQLLLQYIYIVRNNNNDNNSLTKKRPTSPRGKDTLKRTRGNNVAVEPEYIQCVVNNEELTADAINYYMQYLLKTYTTDDRRLAYVDSAYSDDFAQGRIDDCQKHISVYSQNRFRSIQQSRVYLQKARLFFPIFFQGTISTNQVGHWALLVLDTDPLKATYYDSYNRSGRAPKQIVDSLNSLLSCLGYEEIQPESILTVVKIPQQKDKISCGVHVLVHALQLAQGNDQEITLEIDVAAERQQIAQVLRSMEPL